MRRMLTPFLLVVVVLGLAWIIISWVGASPGVESDSTAPPLARGGGLQRIDTPEERAELAARVEKMGEEEFIDLSADLLIALVEIGDREAARAQALDVAERVLQERGVSAEAFQGAGVIYWTNPEEGDRVRPAILALVEERAGSEVRQEAEELATELYAAGPLPTDEQAPQQPEDAPVRGL
jgi:hypothetical protein